MLSAARVRGAAWLLLGVIAASFIVAPDGTAEPKAKPSSSCAYNDTSVWTAPPVALRAAAVCLINRARTRRGLPRLYEQGQLDGAAQGHTNQMVAHDFFGHAGIPASNPGMRISAAGFDWSAYGEAIATGYATAWKVVHAWLGSTEHCQILLSPTYRYIGVGVNRRGVVGWTNTSGTWTADLALRQGARAPSSDSGPANGCPY